MPTRVDRYRQLQAYETEANRRVLESLATVPASSRSHPSYPRLMGLLPHNLLARQVWLWRINALPYQNPADWFPVLTIEETRTRSEEVDRPWAQYLGGLMDADLDRIVRYTSSEGMAYESRVEDILTHVFNHSTYHRGQIARLVTELGGKRAVTDYIAVTRRTLA